MVDIMDIVRRIQCKSCNGRFTVYNATLIYLLYCPYCGGRKTLEIIEEKEIE